MKSSLTYSCQYICILLFGFAVCAESLFGSHSKAGAIALAIIALVVASGLFVFLIWFDSKRPPFAERLVTTIFGALYILIFLAIDLSRLFFFLFLLCFWGLLVCVFVLYMKTGKKAGTLLIAELVFAAIPLFIPFGKCTFTTSLFEQKFGFLTLIFSVILLPFAIFCRPKKSEAKPSKKHKAIPTLTKTKSDLVKTVFAKIIFCLLLVFVCFASMVSVNYALDTSEGQKQVVQIVDKASYRYGSRYRYRRNYHLVVELDGKRVSFLVSSSMYQNYKIGDDFPVYFYEGALGEAYYTINQ